MHLTYRELEDFFAVIHRVAESKRIALRGRLKHFQRLGWPAGTNKGKGARVEYGIGQTMSLAMGLEMLQLGLTPERVVAQLKLGGPQLASGFLEALNEYGPYADPIFYIFAPESLHSLRDDDSDKEGILSMMVSRSLLPEMMSQISPMNQWRRFAFINLSNLLDEYIEYFVSRGLGAPENLRDHIERWLRLEKDSLERWQFHIREGLPYGDSQA